MTFVSGVDNDVSASGDPRGGDCHVYRVILIRVESDDLICVSRPFVSKLDGDVLDGLS